MSVPVVPARKSLNGGTIWIVGAVVAVMVLVLASGALVMVVRGSDRGGDSTGVPSGPGPRGEEAVRADGDDADSSGQSASSGDAKGEETAGEPSIVKGTQPTTTAAASVLRPVSARASSERAGVSLRCTGVRVDYSAGNIIDGDVGTGWGTRPGDGAGQSVTVTFDGPVHLSEVGISPGYAKVGPRQDAGCATVGAFPFNRFVSSARYTFDDGSSVVQTFERREDIQTIPVDKVTTNVTITIVSTERPAGADDDTIISEAYFAGRRA